MGEAPSKEELEAAHCWDTVDRVPGRPEMTSLRQRLRLQQSRWRESNGHPIGSQPIVPRAGAAVRPVGSRMPLDYARDSGANFVSPGALDAVKARTSVIERHQMFDAQRLWADLLWSPTLCFNLFGDLAADLVRADRAVHTWWPDAPGAVCDVRFSHSPGRLDASYIGNLGAFDVAFVLDVGDGTRGIVAVETKYHDRIKPRLPKPSRLSRYLEVTDTSGIFASGAIDAVNGTDLCEMWLDHVLMLSMLQHPSRAWSWGRFVIVHAAGNTDFADGCARYRALLTDPSRFSSPTIEELLDAGALPKSTVRAFRDRYLGA
jgi:hypothetical protein